MSCFVPGCASRSRLFKPPKKPEIREKWCEILNKLRTGVQFDINKRSHRVCSLHFEEKAIRKANRFIIEGKVVELVMDNWTLEGDAIPTIFDCVPKSVRPRVKGPRRKIMKVESKPNKKRKIEKNDKIASVETPIKIAFKVEPGPDPLAIPEPEPEPPKPLWLSTKPSDLLQKFCKGSNNSWTFKKFDKHVSGFQVMIENEIPFIYRAITKPIKGAGMNFLFSISGCDVTSEVLNGEDLTEDNFEAIAKKFDLIHKCRGLAGFDSFNECTGGVKRAGKWYSVKCADLGNAVVCLNCKLLHGRLQLKLMRTPKLKKNNVDQVKIPQENQKDLLTENRYYKRRIKRITQSRDDLQKKLHSAKNEVREADVKIVRDSFSKWDIPQDVKEGILKTLKQAKLPSLSQKQKEVETDEEDDSDNKSKSMSPSEQSECSE